MRQSELNCDIEIINKDEVRITELKKRQEYNDYIFQLNLNKELKEKLTS